MFARMFAALLLSAFALAPFSASAGRYTTPEEDIKKNEMYGEQRWKRISPALPPLLGPHASRLRSTISRIRCNAYGHTERYGKFTCSEYTSGIDSSRWKFALGRNAQQGTIVHVFRLRDNTWINHAVIDGDKVTSMSPEARMYEQGGGSANNQSPIGRAVNEVDRALGTAIKGDGKQPIQLPPLRLPPIFGR